MDSYGAWSPKPVRGRAPVDTQSRPKDAAAPAGRGGTGRSAGSAESPARPTALSLAGPDGDGGHRGPPPGLESTRRSLIAITNGGDVVLALMLFVITSTKRPVTSSPGIHDLEEAEEPTKHQAAGLGFTVAERRKPAAYGHRECYWRAIGCSENSPRL
jgi:hypothetical protein